MSGSSQLRTIQALRGVAALLVMMGHLRTIEARQSGATDAGERPLMSDIWVNGASGVDLFFVISGFIMVWVAGNTAAGPRSAGNFILARVFRIYPLWWLFAGLTAAYFWISYGVPWDSAELDRRGMDGIDYMIKSALLIPQAWLPVLNVGWTLIHEMYFYVVFAILLLFPQRWRGPAMLLWAGLVLVPASLGTSTFYASTLLELATYPMTLEFLMGAGAAYLIRANKVDFSRTAFCLGLLSFAIAFATFPLFLGFHEYLAWYRTLFFGVPSALIVYGLVQMELKHNVGQRVSQSLVRIGDWSYALYLSHILVLSGLGRVWFAVFEPSWTARAGFIVVAIAAAICVSALAYYLYERPIIRLGKIWTRQKVTTASPSSP
ncbi:MAG: acyltransferase [Pseudomonadota bacterium]